MGLSSPAEPACWRTLPGPARAVPAVPLPVAPAADTSIAALAAADNIYLSDHP